jgi:hypothetical protein
MTRTELNNALAAAKEEYRESLQTVWDGVNKGQKKQLLKNEQIKAILDRFGVVTEE